MDRILSHYCGQLYSIICRGVGKSRDLPTPRHMIEINNIWYVATILFRRFYSSSFVSCEYHDPAVMILAAYELALARVENPETFHTLMKITEYQLTRSPEECCKVITPKIPSSTTSDWSDGFHGVSQGSSFGTAIFENTLPIYGQFIESLPNKLYSQIISGKHPKIKEFVESDLVPFTPQSFLLSLRQFSFHRGIQKFFSTEKQMKLVEKEYFTCYTNELFASMTPKSVFPPKPDQPLDQASFIGNSISKIKQLTSFPSPVLASIACPCDIFRCKRETVLEASFLLGTALSFDIPTTFLFNMIQRFVSSLITSLKRFMLLSTAVIKRCQSCPSLAKAYTRIGNNRNIHAGSLQDINTILKAIRDDPSHDLAKLPMPYQYLIIPLDVAKRFEAGISPFLQDMKKTGINMNDLAEGIEYDASCVARAVLTSTNMGCMLDPWDLAVSCVVYVLMERSKCNGKSSEIKKRKPPSYGMGSTKDSSSSSMKKIKQVAKSPSRVGKPPKTNISKSFVMKEEEEEKEEMYDVSDSLLKDVLGDDKIHADSTLQSKSVRQEVLLAEMDEMSELYHETKWNMNSLSSSTPQYISVVEENIRILPSSAQSRLADEVYRLRIKNSHDRKRKIEERKKNLSLHSSSSVCSEEKNKGNGLLSCLGIPQPSKQKIPLEYPFSELYSGSDIILPPPFHTSSQPFIDIPSKFSSSSSSSPPPPVISSSIGCVGWLTKEKEKNGLKKYEDYLKANPEITKDGVPTPKKQKEEMKKEIEIVNKMLDSDRKLINPKSLPPFLLPASCDLFSFRPSQKFIKTELSRFKELQAEQSKRQSKGQSSSRQQVYGKKNGGNMPKSGKVGTSSTGLTASDPHSFLNNAVQEFGDSWFKALNALHQVLLDIIFGKFGEPIRIDQPFEFVSGEIESYLFSEQPMTHIGCSPLAQTESQLKKFNSSTLKESSSVKTFGITDAGNSANYLSDYSSFDTIPTMSHDSSHISSLDISSDIQWRGALLRPQSIPIVQSVAVRMGGIIGVLCIRMLISGSSQIAEILGENVGEFIKNGLMNELFVGNSPEKKALREARNKLFETPKPNPHPSSTFQGSSSVHSTAPAKKDKQDSLSSTWGVPKKHASSITAGSGRQPPSSGRQPPSSGRQPPSSAASSRSRQSASRSTTRFGSGFAYSPRDRGKRSYDKRPSYDNRSRSGHQFNRDGHQFNRDGKRRYSQSSGYR
ncbi:hypothetical protein ADUPG1_009341 [Aduncisulcus paluster]|uniref:Uncharacterized protein n=1 Tax=Aduncisulcus paluster TaxID=2918883 RepID=A0ABQ5KWG5_9EUKA|nr:hypothetical protein ADUPG1_009341 [Aduncisulcus paluster]